MSGEGGILLQMDQSKRPVSDLFGILKSWIPSKPEPADVSRDFWMPDHSCRVCYECDSKFTLFNRRHHCRLCGRIFCGRCTANSIPTPSNDVNRVKEDWKKIRVCNYCFKQWKQGISTNSDNGIHGSVYGPSGSPSGGSFGSSVSSKTADCSTITIDSLVRCERVSQSCSLRVSPHQSAVMDHPCHSAAMDMYIDGQVEEGSPSSNNSGADMEDKPSNHFGVDMDRFEYGDDGYSYKLDSNEWVNEYYDQDEVEGLPDPCGSSHSLQPNGEKSDRKSFSSSMLHNDNEPHDSFNLQKEIDHDMGYGYEASSSLCAAEDVEMESVDYEDNGLLWLPPEPENEEDEKDAIVLDDEDEGEASVEFGLGSFGSNDYRSRENFAEDNKKAMNKIVDGHFRALVSQLLQVEDIPVGEDDDRENWLEIITCLCWEAAMILKPDMSRGGGMDPGGYVKVKCIASGRCSESTVVKGVVCKKNVAHRRMATRIEKPCFMILGGALEYQRVSNLLASVDTLLKQEMDHLKMAVAKIDAHHPNVLLVEKSVSRFAQDYILEKDISLVLNIKRPLLERIARCTGAQIIPSVDHLSSQNIGYCDSFHVKRLVEEHGSAGQGGKRLSKTLMYFEGCPRPLGCTILLRGANGDELKKVKAVIQYGVFAAYHLALETSFLADEGASLPELPLKEPITVALPNKSLTADRSISMVPGFTVPANGNSNASGMYHLVHDVVAPTTACTSRPSCLQHTESVSEGPVSVFSQAYCASLRESPSPADEQHKEIQPLDVTSENKFSGDSSKENKSATYEGNSGVIENSRTVHGEGEVATFAFNFNQDEPGSSKEEFPPSPSDNQSILVSLSSWCVLKGTVCERSHLFRIKYYGSFDKPLGRVLQDHLFDQNYRCRSCEMSSDAHVQCYTHRQGTLTISVKKLPENYLPGEHEGKIWMWHRCLRCPRTGGIPPGTRRVVMSDAAWGLSFGKFLELSFSNHAAASRVASCGHSLHRDCLRFYGSGKMVACFRYASIDVHSVFLPPSIVGFNYEIQDWIEKEADEVVDRAQVLFSIVLNALTEIVQSRSSGGSIKGSSKVPESRFHIAELKEVLQTEKAEFEEIMQNTLKREVKKGEPAIDILEINRLRRQLLFQSYMWDHRLVYASILDQESLSEPEERALEEAQEILETNVLNSEDCGSKSPQKTNQPKIIHQMREAVTEAKHVGGDLVKNCDIQKTCEPSNKLDSGIPASIALLDSHFSFIRNFSDTLDAAWTSKDQPGVELSGSVSVDSSLAAVERQGEELDGGVKITPAPFLTTSKSADNTISWLRMPFVNFYRALNKNFLGFNQKLDTVGVYNPIYVSSFQELEQQSGARLSLPVCTNETVIPVYDDEPTSIISYALVSHDYYTQVCDDGCRLKGKLESTVSLPLRDLVMFHSFHSGDNSLLKSFGSLDDTILSMSTSQSSHAPDPQSHSKSLHVRISFSDNGPIDQVKYAVTNYYAKQFHALRRICCPSELDFVRSLSRCKKWGAQGGKSNVFFAKTLDDRFIIKQVTKTELESFMQFAPEYFKYLIEAISTKSPTCLAKILGIYQVTTKKLKGGKETKMDVLVMENILFGRKVTRLYDLKGSTRSRYNSDASGSNKVLLDENLIEAMPTSPIFLGNKAKRLLERAVWNDTAFLASVDVMDYSLLVGVDEEKHELVLGIIDFMRQYTWDKHLETWVKASGILGGPKNASPTVISPKQYKKRFRKAMTTYFLMVPDQWSPLDIIPSVSHPDDHSQGGDMV